MISAVTLEQFTRLVSSGATEEAEKIKAAHGASFDFEVTEDLIKDLTEDNSEMSADQLVKEVLIDTFDLGS